MREIMKTQQGHTIVEATIIYPITIMLFFVLLYAGLFICQRAILQSSLEDALIYYKNTDTDTYVSTEKKISFTTDGETITATGNTYESTKKLDPYRNIFHAVGSAFGNGINQSDFKNFFVSSYNHISFYKGDNINVTIKENNYVIYKRITATATQKMNTAVNIAWVGGENSLSLTAEATVVAVDGDSMIRDVDFAKDIVSQTKLGKKASELVDKAVDAYNKLKEKFM